MAKTKPESDNNSKSSAGANKGPAEGEIEKINEAECGKLENGLTDENRVVCPAPNGGMLGSNLWGRGGMFGSSYWGRGGMFGPN